MQSLLERPPDGRVSDLLPGRDRTPGAEIVAYLNGPRDGVDPEPSARFERSRLRRCRADADLLGQIPALEEAGVHDDDGFRTIAEWVSSRMGNSVGQAWKLVRAARALQGLQVIPQALRKGEIGLEKVVEMTRFVTPADEDRVLRWAKRASLTSVRNRADRETRASNEETKDIHARRCLTVRTEENGAAMYFGLFVPADQGATVLQSLDRLVPDVPDFPEDPVSDDPLGGAYGDPTTVERKRADALVMLASMALGADTDKDRATVVIHERLDNLLDLDGRGSSLPGGGVVHPEVVRRLCCDARIQLVIENGSGAAIGLGHVTRTISPALRRLLFQRDGGCTFPGCNATRYLDGHHVVWWEDHGPTDLDNLTLTCGFHHKLVHEFGWSVRLDEDQRSHWFRPDGAPAATVRRTRGPTASGDPPREQAQDPQALERRALEMGSIVDARTRDTVKAAVRRVP